MDKFTRNFLLVALIGTAICAVVDKHRETKDNPKLTVDEQQFRIDAEAEEPKKKDFPEFLYGSYSAPLEKEKEYIAIVTSQDRYIATNYYLGDHYSDPRLVIVCSETTGDVVQIFTTISYEKRNEISKALNEVPD